MANYVMNRLHMEGIAHLPLFTEDERGRIQLDFNKAVPMPEELNLGAGSQETDAIAYIIRECCDKTYLGRSYYTGSAIKDRERNFAALEQNIGREGALELGLKYITNIVRYGHSSWYGWRIANWGTKWNATETEIIGEDEVKFQTAWSAPEPFVRSLSEMYPKTEIELMWADEDIGMNTGCLDLKGGEGSMAQNDDRSQDAFEAYIECWGEDDRLVRRNGIWELEAGD